MIKFVMYSLPGKIMFSTLFCGNSSAFDRVTVSLECQTDQAWRSGPGRITVQKQTPGWTGECTHFAFATQKWKQNCLVLLTDPFANGEFVRTPLPPHTLSHVSIFLRHRRSTSRPTPPNSNLESGLGYWTVIIFGVRFIVLTSLTLIVLFVFIYLCLFQPSGYSVLINLS